MNEIMNSWWMYLIGACVTLFVLLGSIFFIVKAYKDAKAINMDKKVLNKVIFNSAIFTILPSISILIGVITLSGNLGVPLPWIRLTVIGALHYEGTAASSVHSLYADINGILPPMNNEIFVTTAWVMTLGILTGPIFCLLGFKAYDKKVLSKTRVQEAVTETKAVEEKEVNTKPKKDFGTILFNAVFIAMVSSFLAVDFDKIFNTGKTYKDTSGVEHLYTPTESYIPIIVVVVTFGAMALCDFIEKKFKQKWLSSFALGLSMLVGMATAVLVNYLSM